MGAATAERFFRRSLKRQFRELHPPRFPAILGFDERFPTRRWASYMAVDNISPSVTRRLRRRALPALF